MEQRVRFCKTPNAERMAYAVTGEGPPLVVAPGWISNLQLHWDAEGPRRFWESLSRHHSLIRYDKPGTGLSDRDVEDLDPEARVRDISALVDHLNLDKFSIFGWSEGGPLAVAYAARNPHRVDHIVLYGAFARWWVPAKAVEPMIQMIRHQWGAGSAAMTALFVPSNDADQVAYWTQLQRDSASPQTAAKMLEENKTIDVREGAAQLACSALVLHRDKDQIVPVDNGRELAALIPESDFVLLSGENHLPWWGDTDALLRAADSFLRPGAPAQDAAPTATPAGGALRTVIFTDIVGHTEMMSRLGDAKGREVLREHEEITREALKAHGGIELKTMGDGFMASFTSVVKAVECAIALQRGFAERNEAAAEPLHVRVGLNAGEPIEEDGPDGRTDLFGETVILASRIAATAEGGEVLASLAVRELCAGKGFLFADAGAHVMRGFEDPVLVFAVRWQE